MVQPEIRDLFTDRKKLIETLVPIEDKDRQLVPFILNPIQSQMLGECTPKDVSIKPAQVGGTSLYMCDFLLDCVITPGTTAVIISYDEFITGRLLRKAQAFYDNMKVTIPTLPRLFHKSVSEKTFIFEDSLGVKRGESSFYIASAKGFAMPRGEPIHDLLLDEFAFYPPGAAKDVFAAALQRVPLTIYSKVRVLSTPNGEDNAFFELYKAAKEGKEYGRSVFQSHFYPWYQLPEYSMTPESTFCLPGDDTPILQNLTPDEIILLLRLERLGIEQTEAFNKLRWRRYKIAEFQSLKRGGDTSLLFGQEYPEDDVTCFQMAGDMVFDPNIVNEKIRGCYPPTTQMMHADIWELPEVGARYMVCIDPGEGKKSDSVSTVWKMIGTMLVHVATLAGKYENDVMAEMSVALAILYNNAMIAPEDALGIVVHLKGYSNVYYRTDPVTGMIGKDIGWRTTRSTKPYMITELVRNMSQLDIHDVRILEQLRNIRWVGGRAVAVGADDFVMSTALAVVCQNAVPIERGYVGDKG